MIVKCSHCGEILSSKNFGEHECNLRFRKCKNIEVVYFRNDSYGDKQLMTGLGTDDVLYTFEVVPRKPIPLIVPIGDDFSHGKKKRLGDGDFTEPGYRLFRAQQFFDPAKVSLESACS